MQRSDDIHFLVNLGLVIHADDEEARRILKFVKESGGRVVYKVVAPRWQRLWIQREQDPQERVETAAESGEAP